MRHQVIVIYYTSLMTAYSTMLSPEWYTPFSIRNRFQRPWGHTDERSSLLEPSGGGKKTRNHHIDYA
jgi:hypothetical protein